MFADRLAQWWAVRRVCTPVSAPAQSASVEARVQTVCAPRCHTSNHFESYFGQGRLFFWSPLCSPTADTVSWLLFI